jgi:lipopolysaccharide transport system permease protein
LLFIDPIRILVRHWPTFIRTTVTEIQSRYAGSALGLLWMVLAPLLLMTIYAVVYLVIFNVRTPELPPALYVVYVLSGLLPFLAFSEALSTGSASLSMNRAILLSTVFPAELVPLRAVLSSQAPTAIGMTLCLALATLITGPRLTWLAVPVIWFAMMLFVGGIVLTLSLTSLLVKDIQQALGFVTMLLLIASPIGYTPTMVPPALKLWLLINPLAHYLGAIHEVVVFGRLPGVGSAAAILVMSITSFCVGFWVFGRTKKVFFDYA